MVKRSEATSYGGVSINRGAKTYSGTYSLTGGRHPILTVEFEGRSRTTQLGGSQTETLARLLLSELIREVGTTDSESD